MTDRPDPPSSSPDDPPPLLGSWRNLYLLVLGFLFAQIVVYWLVTRAYA